MKPKPVLLIFLILIVMAVGFFLNRKENHGLQSVNRNLNTYESTSDTSKIKEVHIDKTNIHHIRHSKPHGKGIEQSGRM